ncbi:hypothetical protein KIMH_00160 [Bombiscardovia apis]|uniref:GtrA-like protein n=1 Tax=Bombiscardovia apis TaxID=2932182 RepID=A0ABM8BAN9_9BIFI|nr:hypothetical protein [Bombiscardovia apis]BDR53905.1 hypothetical protein KIMH_00160 [Bombiscardovia apis]
MSEQSKNTSPAAKQSASEAQASVSKHASVRWWQQFSTRHPELAQFVVFTVLSNGITILQLVLMPVLKAIFNGTSLVNVSFQFWRMGTTGGTPYYLFDYAAGAMNQGGGGGLAYFLAVEITLLIAQVINFFLQRNVTFKSNSSPWVAAFWYLIAYIVITIVAAGLQGWYKDPVYNFFQNSLGWGTTGTTIADFVTMMINALISFWVFYPIFKVIFKQEPDDDSVQSKSAVKQ